MTTKKSARETGRQGGRASHKKMTKAELSAHQSHAAKVRHWQNRGKRDVNGKFCPRPVLWK